MASSSNKPQKYHHGFSLQIKNVMFDAEFVHLDGLILSSLRDQFTNIRRNQRR